MKKKIFRSRDVIFYEDQTISYCEKTEKVKAISDGVIDPTVIHFPLQRTIDGGAEMTGDEAPETVVDDGMPESDQAVEQGEQSPQQVISEPQIRRTNRESRPSSKYSSSEYVLITDEGQPENFQEVHTHADKVSWMKAMQEEMHSLLKNDTYELVELPKGRKALRNKWVFKLKKDSDGKLLKYKARLVVKGFGQKKGIDFDEIFSPVVKMSSIRVVLSLTASLDLELEQLDVKTAFLHGDLNEEIYMSQPERFEVKGKEHMVCKLKKSVYGLKQAPRQWYKKFDSFMVSLEYKRTYADHCVYFRTFTDGNFIILLLYVDDMLIAGNDSKLIGKLKERLFKSFDMKDLGPAKQMLGMRITRDRKAKKLWLS